MANVMMGGGNAAADNCSYLYFGDSDSHVWLDGWLVGRLQLPVSCLIKWHTRFSSSVCVHTVANNIKARIIM